MNTTNLRRNAETAECTHCRAELPRSVRYCPVCGTPSPFSRPGAGVRYRSIELNEYGKALVCPHCENEEPTPGNYCKICGKDIVNRCADMPDPGHKGLLIKGCRALLQGNARYCSKCGNESTFFQNGWLGDWRSENIKQAIHNVKVAVNFDEIKSKKDK